VLRIIFSIAFVVISFVGSLSCLASVISKYGFDLSRTDVVLPTILVSLLTYATISYFKDN
jgi:hypothetical protein